MRGLVSKRLYREADEEFGNDRKMGNEVYDRHLVTNRAGSVVNHPFSIRGLYRKLKHLYTRMRSHGGTPKLAADRHRARSKTRRPQPENRIMHIAKPLMFILEHCPPLRATDALGNPKRDALTGEFVYEAHPTYAKARRLASRGRGREVQAIARSLLPA